MKEPMTADTYFEERYVQQDKEPSYYDYDKQRFDACDMRDFAEQFAKQYARQQIEKDRPIESELMGTVKADSKYYDSDRTAFLEGAETVLRQLRNREINLD